MPSLPNEESSEAIPSNTNDVENVNGTSNGTATGEQKSPSKNKLSAAEENGSVPDENFEEIMGEEAIVSCTFSNLIERMRDFQYDRRCDKENLVNLKCRLLFERDYNIQMVVNEVCINYPKEILVPVSKKEDKETNCMNFDAELYSELVKESRVARLRCRYVAPAILFDNKFICRSGTLCVWTSALFENVKGSIPSMADIAPALLNPMRSLWNLMSATYESAQFVASEEALKNQHSKDVEILHHLKVDRICDLMVEYNKNYRTLVNVSSTEKANEEIYKGMKGEEMPYPGCEFFTQYCGADRKPDGLVFNWNQSDVTRTLVLTEDPKLFPDMGIENFKEWDLVCLTQQYLKIMLSYLLTGTGGILVHCISGWDRTPLFVSLIRLSLWADGVIHTSLKYEDMAYLTVAYDWFLFGHNLPDRLKKKEDIMHFCFNFLQHITSDEFSITRMFQELEPEIKKDRNFPEFVPERRKVLNDISDYVLKAYNEHIINSKDYQSWISASLRYFGL